MDISIELPDVKLGVLEAEDVRVAPADAALAGEMDAACERLRREQTLETLMETPSVRAVRAMFRAWQVDAARYRPSSEALLRRVVQGKGLYRVSNVVDINNLGSIEAGWPFGSYARAEIAPPAAFRHGLPGEKYEGIGKRTWHLEGQPVLADQRGPFGSPISDSERTKVTEATRGVLFIVYAPAGSGTADLDLALAQLARRLERFTGARIPFTGVIAP